MGTRVVVVVLVVGVGRGYGLVVLVFILNICVRGAVSVFILVSDQGRGRV